MLAAILICSDPECPEVLELCGELAELEATLCDCGCALQAIAFLEAEEIRLRPPAPVELAQAA